MQTKIQRNVYLYPNLTWRMRLATWIVLVTQLLLPFQGQILAAAEETARTAGEPKLPVARVQSKKLIHLPAIEAPAPGPHFSDPPTDEEIFRSHVLSEPLRPFGPTTAEENRALGQALLKFNARTDNDEFGALTVFLEQYPHSAWRVSLLTELGDFFRHHGYFTRALEAWQEAWEGGKEVTKPEERRIANEALGELAVLTARLGRMDRLEVLVEELQKRHLQGATTEQLTSAREGFGQMKSKPGKAFRCGPLALGRLWTSERPGVMPNDVIKQAQSTTNGTSLSQVSQWAQAAGMDYEMAKRAKGAKVIVPSVVNWKAGHFAALVREEKGLFLVQDPTFTYDIWVSGKALDEEGSGYYLVPKQELPEGWMAISQEEGGKVWGKGAVEGIDNRGPGCGGGGSGGGYAEGGGPGGMCRGMANYTFRLLDGSLQIADIPLGYTPPLGPDLDFQVTYNHREAGHSGAFDFSNIGDKWNFGWLAYIKDDSTLTSADVEYHTRWGGWETFENQGGRFLIHPNTHTVLSRTSTNSYERMWPDGAKEVFACAQSVSGPRKVFMTKITDAQGNAVTFQYDSDYRLRYVIDAIGQTNVLSYRTNSTVLDPAFFQIAQVTDAFGRHANFEYNGDNELAKITDVMGITSEFGYDGNEFITGLTTPYGTTTFTNAHGGYLDTYRMLEATDPLGQKERLECNGTTDYATTDTVPVGITQSANGHLDEAWSVFWNKKAMHDAPGNYSQARRYRYLFEPNGSSILSGRVGYARKPLEGGYWYEYPAQSGENEGTNGLPIRVGHILDDGSTQLYQYEYNDLGRVTKVTDPTNRVTLLMYDTNNLIDLLEVRQQMAGTNTDLLFSAAYTNHLPLYVVDAARRTNWFGYNANWQLTAVTNAKEETVTLGYNAINFLTSITGALPGATATFTYDATNRLRTMTDSEGYQVKYDYDDWDRPTKVTYPDNTFEQTIYNNLDAVLMKDRRGHWSGRTYNALRQLTDITDALGQVTHFEWCSCGSPYSVTDPLGRTTSWIRDIQSRVISKVYPDNTKVNYQYETNTSRLKSVTDAKNQTTFYNYYIDNNLQSVAYTNAVIATPVVEFTYDTNYNRVLTMVDGIGTNVYSYYPVTNALGSGRLASIDGALTNDTITYFYDELGRVTNEAINSVGMNVTYDALGRVTMLTNVLGTFTTSYVNTTPRLSSVGYPNGQTTILSYFGTNNDERLQSIWNKNATNGTLSKFDYTYDAEGQIQTWQQQLGTISTNTYTLAYDRIDQLVEATLKDSISSALIKKFVYCYDRAGNRTTEQIEKSSSDAQYNELNQLTNRLATGAIQFKGHLSATSTVMVAGSPAKMTMPTTFEAMVPTTIGTNVVQIVATDYSTNHTTNTYTLIITNNLEAKTLQYDLNGNLIHSAALSSTCDYEWDAVDRLVKITQHLSEGYVLKSEFAYDGFGRRIASVESSNNLAISSNRYVWSGAELCEEKNWDGTTTKRFFRLGEQIGNTNYFFTLDHLGSVREMTDSNNVVRARYSYECYGNAVRLEGDRHADIGFAGYFFHRVSGLNLTYFRAYSSDIGKWINRDPIGEAGGINLFNYVDNNPINSIDPSGLCATLIEATAFLVFVAVVGFGLYEASKTEDNLTTVTKASQNGSIQDAGTMGQKRVQNQIGQVAGQAKNLSAFGTSASGGPLTPVRSGEDAAVSISQQVFTAGDTKEGLQTTASALGMGGSQQPGLSGQQQCKSPAKTGPPPFYKAPDGSFYQGWGAPPGPQFKLQRQ